MLWELDAASRVGLAEQIMATVRRAVVNGDLAAGDLLPSSKDLSVVLGVNQNTVLAAYRQLRDEQVLEFRRGRGVRVSQDAGDESRILEAAREFIRIGVSLGYSEKQLPGLLRKVVQSS